MIIVSLLQNSRFLQGGDFPFRSHNNMSRLSRSPSIKPPLPLSKSPSSVLPRKVRVGTQRTLDTATPQDLGSQIDTLLRINEEELLREVKESLRVIDDYRNSLLRKKQAATLREELRAKEDALRQKTKEIFELNEQVGRLKDVYSRPKAKTPANQYMQQHLKVFTLAEELQKMRKHLQLHIDHHRNLKQKAKDLHQTIKNALPQYYERQVKRGLKPLSYGEFRKRAIAAQAEKKMKERLRVMSERSVSIRSRSSSVKEIIQCSSLAPPPEKSLWQMQRRRSIITRAKGATQRKFSTQAKTLQDQLQFLRKQDNLLADKEYVLAQQVQKLQSSLNHSLQFTFISKDMTVYKPLPSETRMDK